MPGMPPMLCMLCIIIAAAMGFIMPEGEGASITGQVVQAQAHSMISNLLKKVSSAVANTPGRHQQPIPQGAAIHEQCNWGWE